MSEVSYVTGSSVTLKHGFFKRHGGVSTDQFTSLNATDRVGDSPENVLENRRRACDALGVDAEKLVFLDRLPHGNNNQIVTSEQTGAILQDCDALITADKNVPIMIAVADCNPIIVTDNANFVALVHSGWRGTKANIVDKTIKQLIETYNANPSELVALIGPSIAPQDYPVGQEVAEQFATKYLQEVDGNIHLDLWSAVEDQLAASGVGSIENLRISTYKSGDYFSFREDNGDTGRFMCVVQL